MLGGGPLLEMLEVHSTMGSQICRTWLCVTKPCGELILLATHHMCFSNKRYDIVINVTCLHLCVVCVCVLCVCVCCVCVVCVLCVCCVCVVCVLCGRAIILHESPFPSLRSL